MEKQQSFKFCNQCGTKNDADARFCINCGYPFEPAKKTKKTKKAKKAAKSSVIDSATAKLNSWTGGEGAVKISLGDFFSQVFKKHTKKQAEDIFAVGTENTTPALSDIEIDRAHPWLFSRILAFIFALSILLYVLALLNPRPGVVVALEVILAIAVPVSALMLFFESNILKNISIYEVTKLTLLGGVLSLILTILLDNLLGNSDNLDLVSSLLTGFTEEAAKVLVAGYFVNRLHAKGIFNGLLIGAAVGTGFAAFENIMYLFNDQTGQMLGINTALTRTLFSISDHTEWCSITTAALVIAMAGTKVDASAFLSFKFLRFFFLVVLLHAAWDYFNTLPVMAIVVVITWLTVFVFMNAGLRELTEMKKTAKEKPAGK